METYRKIMAQVVPGLRENKSDSMFYWPNGSRDYFVGCDNEERIKSLGADIILVDQAEELKESVWMLLEGRLSAEIMPRGILAAACNPSRKGKSHWLYRQFFVEKMGRVWKTKTTDNVFLPEDFIKYRVPRFKGRYKQLYIDGDWIGFEGLIYDNYDPTVHCVPSFAIPQEWPRYAAIDFGFTNPCSVGWYAVDGDGHNGPEGAIYLYRELYRTRLLVEDLAKSITKHSKGESVRRIWSDHDSGDRATLARYGIGTAKADKRVKEGIELVYGLLSPQPTKDGEKPLLYFMDDSLVEPDMALEADELPMRLTDEISGYEYEEPSEGKSAKETPHKFQDHACDQLRYACMGIKLRVAVPSSL